MAKFKVGDKVRRTHHNSNGGIMFGDIATVAGYENSDLLLDEYTADVGCGYSDSYFELLTPQYTTITPKVGEKYRVLKTLLGWADLQEAKGLPQNITIESVDGDGDFMCVEHDWRFSHKCSTTEYLELVSEPEKKYIKVPDGYFANMPIFVTNELCAEQVENMRAGKIIKTDLRDIRSYPEPINQSIIKKTMNFIKKALLSKDDKNLIKAGYMDDNMNLTNRGREALEFIIFTENKAKLVEMAEAQIAEDKADKE
jgi:hypothetical protein